MSEVDGVKAINKVHQDSTTSLYKKQIIFPSGSTCFTFSHYYDWRAGLPDILYFD